MALNCVELSPPERTPVLVREFAEHLRLSTGFREDLAEDSVLELYLRTATSAIEARLGLALVSRAMELRITQWSSATEQALPWAPVTELTSVCVIDRDGQRSDIDLNTVSVPLGVAPAVLRAARGLALPKIQDLGMGEVRFTAGFGATGNDVPADLRQAILLLAAHYYENRSLQDTALSVIPFGVLALLEPHRMLRV